MPQISSNEIPFNEAQRIRRETPRMTVAQPSSSVRFYNAASQTAVPGREASSVSPACPGSSRSILKHPALIILVLIIVTSFGVRASKGLQPSELRNRFETTITAMKDSIKKCMPAAKKTDKQPQASIDKKTKKREKKRIGKSSNPPYTNYSGTAESRSAKAF